MATKRTSKRKAILSKTCNDRGISLSMSVFRYVGVTVINGIVPV